MSLRESRSFIIWEFFALCANKAVLPYICCYQCLVNIILVCTAVNALEQGLGHTVEVSFLCISYRAQHQIFGPRVLCLGVVEVCPLPTYTLTCSILLFLYYYINFIFSTITQLRVLVVNCGTIAKTC